MTLSRAGAVYEYFSPSNTVHVINHNLDTLTPTVTIYDDSTYIQATPTSVAVTTANTVTITFGVNTPIIGKIRV